MTLLTNKTIMTYDRATAVIINEKYRMDALRVFISGTKKGLSDVLFSARPNDLPSALALAQEVESNRERYLFATNFARSLDNKEKGRFELRQQDGNTTAGIRTIKNPHFSRRQGPVSGVLRNEELVPPVDTDQSMRTVQSARPATNGPPQSRYYENQMQDRYYNNQASGQAIKRRNSGSARFTGPKQQRINHISQDIALAEQEEDEYDNQAELVASEIDAEEEFDEINFLVKTPCCHS